MIGFIEGTVLFCDSQEVIVKTNQGIGYQVHFNKIEPVGKNIELYISHIIRETSEALFGFNTIKEKKFFELLLLVKGVGPKSAFTLINSIGMQAIVTSIQTDNKKILTKAPGIGPKAAAQIILDLHKKIQKINFYSSRKEVLATQTINSDNYTNGKEIDDAIMACKELGLSENIITPLIQKLALQNETLKAEQLVHLVLKES